MGLLFSAREKVLNSFKSRLFPIKNLDTILTHEPAAEPAAKKHQLKTRNLNENCNRNLLKKI